MTSSIFRPRRSRAWPEPSTHLTESTMLVLPEPLGPTIAVTPPSNRISVGRANVLKPRSCSERRNKGRFTVADAVVIRLSPEGWMPLQSVVAPGLLQGLAGLAALRRFDVCRCYLRRGQHRDRGGGLVGRRCRKGRRLGLGRTP